MGAPILSPSRDLRPGAAYRPGADTQDTMERWWTEVACALAAGNRARAAAARPERCPAGAPPDRDVHP